MAIYLDEDRKEVEKALYRNEENITKDDILFEEKLISPSVKNWLKDFLNIKITPKAFGRDRRMPITNKYRG